MSKEKAKHCEECKYLIIASIHGGGSVVECTKGYKPRYYFPRFIKDTNYGWKRKCNEYEQR